MLRMQKKDGAPFQSMRASVCGCKASGPAREDGPGLGEDGENHCPDGTEQS